MKADNIRALVAHAASNTEPDDDTAAAAIGEGIEIVLSIADSLARIADNSERLAECVETRASEFGNHSSFRTS